MPPAASCGTVKYPPVNLAADQRRPRRRNRNGVRTVGWTCLQQQHPFLRILRQSRGDNATSAARADHHVLELLHVPITDRRWQPSPTTADCPLSQPSNVLRRP